MVTISPNINVVRTDIASARAAAKSTTVLHEAMYPPVQVNNDGVAGTYSTYTQLSAGLGYDIELIGVTLTRRFGATLDAGHFIVDIAKGAAAAEVVIAQVSMNYEEGGTATTLYIAPVYVPFPTPILVTNQRLAARLKSTLADTAADVYVALHWRKTA